ncbi:hypothetical protein ACFQ6B_08910 [Streptomyces wedmorensis]|uniref:Tetratricopeptide repeat protein n=1 Tax=Streptomyces wedmorensis TaxID=43759 RepID=A0ABW6ISP4_STRWE
MRSRSPDEFRLGVPSYGGGPGAGDEPVEAREQLHRARRFTAEGHPAAGGAWERAATALRRAGGTITPGDHADALDSTALDCRGRARAAAGPLFARAADLHERAGQHGKALVSRMRAVLAGEDAGGTARFQLGELCERAAVLYRTGRATAGQATTVLLLHARARADRLDTLPDPAAGAAGLREELGRLITSAAPHRADPAVLCPLADARALLGRISAPDDPARALVHLRAAVAGHRAAGRPWGAAEHELVLAGLLRATGAHEEAAALLRSALRAALPSDGSAASLRRGDRARLCLALARAVAGPHAAGRGRGGWRVGTEEGSAGSRGTGRGTDGRRRVEAEEVALLVEAVRLTGGAAVDPCLGALARLRLGSAYAELGRCREAVGLFEEALRGFAEDGDEAGLVRAGAWLAHSAQCLGDAGRAGREYTRAAARAGRWEDARHAEALGRVAAGARAAAGSPERTDRAGAGCAGPRSELRGLPEPYGQPGRYQVNVYGDVGGTGRNTVAVPRTRVQGCV